ncbi:Ras GTPase-activating-like protein IQGAP1 [Mus musculus] [Rhizoctonia solani]|uniref:Ras GTPase-activating-like protein IQGAP1 [Mus musculus] n=1 Tax=Rhizoctonia solani TaxID=456999 RepID=A0A0K6G9U4_9AGAM|nr:Ras GTPase-activating-like protein IQGAP1 [Mus musculus] [Rhizoctonia solani]
MRDFLVVAEVTQTSLVDAVLPSLSSEGLETATKTLTAVGHIENPETNNPRWRCLPQDPRDSEGLEDQRFRFFEVIARAIEESHAPEGKEWVALNITGQVTPVGFRYNTSRPDGFMYFKRESSTDPVGWSDIIMPMEFKSKDEEGKMIDDYAKLVWSMHHIMRTDPRRRCVYGLTCENTKARLWYNDRSDIVVSTEFDVNKDWKLLVRIILSMFLASPSQLGYDPTMVANSPSNGNLEPTYDITVHNSDTKTATQYRTIRMLSDIGADSPVGRGTRVWVVQKLVNGVPQGPLYALKDVWVHETSDPEHKVLKEIREAQPAYSQHLLTPLDYGYVPHDLTEPSIPDNTHKNLRRRQLEPTGRVLRVQSTPTPRPPAGNTGTGSRKAKSASRDSVGRFETVPNPSQGGHVYLSRDTREHYRVVFEEIGEPVHDLRKFVDIFTAIQGGWEGLHAIHLSERVHRDVSSGNILLVPNLGTAGQRGAIMDLEYAKKVDDTSAPHDVRTGTETFMATEVACMEHHRLSSLRSLRSFLKRPTLPQTDLARELQELRAQLQKQNKALRPNSNPDPAVASNSLPPFRHNPLHDMESIWWLCIWMMLYLVPSGVQGEQYIENYPKVFFNHFTRRDFVCARADFLALTSHLSELSSLVELMSGWQEKLNRLYNYSYETQDTTSNPLTRIRIDDKTLQAGYEFGKIFLESLKRDAESVSTEFVTLSEKYQELKKNVLSAIASSNPESVPSSKLKLVFEGVVIALKRRRTQADQNTDRGVLERESDVFE